MSGFVRFDEGLNMDAQINTFGNWEDLRTGGKSRLSPAGFHDTLSVTTRRPPRAAGRAGDFEKEAFQWIKKH